jgi:two-component system, LytTR family, response regulator
MSNITAVIIDDEAFNRDLLRSLISQLHPDFIVTGEAATITEGYKTIQALKPDVVFLDVKMPDGTGFDLLKLFDTISFEVVFVSGFDEYAVKAFDYNALDYVLKPVDLDKFGNTLNKVRSRVLNNVNYLGDLKKIIETYDVQDAIITKIPIHYNDKVILLPVNEIMYIQSQQGCTCFYRSHSEKHLSAKQLSDFDFILEHFPNFLKITKGTYVNLNFIESYSKGFDCTITMKDGSIHEISRRKKSQVLEMIGKGKNSNKMLPNG